MNCYEFEPSETALDATVLVALSATMVYHVCTHNWPWVLTLAILLLVYGIVYKTTGEDG